MLQKQRKVGEPSIPEVFTGGGTASKAAAAAALGRTAMSKLDAAAETARAQVQEQERVNRQQAVRKCSC